MTPETPASGVKKIWEYNTSVAYDVGCTCGDPNHTVVFVVEQDDDCQMIVVNTYVTVKTDYWSEFYKANVYDIDNPVLYTIASSFKGLVNSVATRVCLIYDILVHGYVKYEQSVLMPKQVALNYAAAMQNAVYDLEQKQKDKGDDI